MGRLGRLAKKHWLEIITISIYALLIVSVVDVIAHNLTTEQYLPFNIFKILSDLTH